MTLTEQTRDKIFEKFIRNQYACFETVKLPTERELAKEYGVSLVTIRRAIDEFEQKGYVQRRQGSGTYVVDKRTFEKHYTIALAVPTGEYSTFYSVLAGRIEPELRRLGHEALLMMVEDADTLLKTLEARKIKPDAVVVCGFLIEHTKLAAAKIPYVIAGGEGYQSADNVVFDLRAGAYLAVKHLTALGHRRILFLSNIGEKNEIAPRINREFIFETSSRYQGYCDALEESRIPIDKSLVLRIGESARSSYLAIKELIVNGKFNCTAIFASTDNLANGAISALTESGISIPEQISLIGCNNLTEEREMLLPLTSLDLRLNDVAEAALRLLLNRIENIDRKGEFLSLSLIPNLVRPEGTSRKLIHQPLSNSHKNGV